MNESRVNAARTAVEEYLNRNFGDGGIENLIASALTAGLDQLRDADGVLEVEDVESLLWPYDLDALAAPLAATDRDDVAGEVNEFLDDETLDNAIETMIGSVAAIGGMDSSSFAVMTAGSITHNVLLRGDHYTTFDTGTEELFDYYSMSGRYAVADDPSFHKTQLAIAAEIDGLRPGLWLADEADLDVELRELTMGKEGLGGLLDEVVYRDEDVDALVEDWWGALAKATQCGETAARPRLRELVAGGEWRTGEERDLLWELWKQVRPR